MILSVVMPVYDAAAFVAAAVESALREMPGNSELIAIDDGSKDGSLDVLLGIEDRRLKILKQENRGAAQARNLGLEAAAGRYVAFLDADDLALQGRFEIPLEALEADPGLAILGAGAGIVGAEGQPIREENEAMGDTRLRWITHFNSPFTFSAVTVRRSALRFDSSVIPAEDYAYCADKLDEGKGRLLADRLCAYRIHPGQVTKRRNDLLRESGNLISQRKIRERLSVDLPLDIVFLMRHLLAFGWQRVGREHQAQAFEAERTLRHLFSLFKKQEGLDAGETARIEESLLRL